MSGLRLDDANTWQTNFSEGTDSTESSLQSLFACQLCTFILWLVAWLRSHQEPLCVWTYAVQEDRRKVQAWRSKAKELGRLHVARRVHPRTHRYFIRSMTEPITNIDDFVEVYFESGCARLRFKQGITPKSLLDEKLNRSFLKRFLGCLKSNH